MTRASVHPLFGAALAAMHPNYVHHASIHLEGPQPMVPRRVQTEVIYWCAEIVLPLVGPAERTRFAELLAAARAPDGDADARTEVLRELETLGNVFEETDPLRLAGLVGVAGTRVGLSPRNAVRTARAAVARTIRILDGEGRKGMSAQDFLRQLDDRLMRAELVACAKRFCRDVEARLEAIVHRGGDHKGDTVAWVGRLKPRPDGPSPCWFGLVRRIGFHFSEGAIGDALAIMPDEHLEVATAAAFASSH